MIAGLHFTVVFASGVVGQALADRTGRTVALPRTWLRDCGGWSRWVVAAWVPGVAAADAERAFPGSSDRAVLTDRSNHVVAARRLKTALLADDRAQRELIDAHKSNQRHGRQLHDQRQQFHAAASILERRLFAKQLQHLLGVTFSERKLTLPVEVDLVEDLQAGC